MRIRTFLSSHSMEIRLLLVLLIVYPPIPLPSQQKQEKRQQATAIRNITGPILPSGLDSSWHLVFDDEFNSRTLDSTKWITNAGRGGTCTSVDVGGRNAWSGPPDISTPWPSYINIDYVKVYQQSSSDHCTTHCLTGNLTSKVNLGCGKKR